MNVASSKCGAPAIESRLAPKPKPSNFRRLGEPVGEPLVRAVQHASIEELAVPLGLDREMAVAVVLVDGRPVVDAPVDQPAAPVKDTLPVPMPPSGKATCCRRAPR